jgi:Protein of unknown function (DUF1329)
LFESATRSLPRHVYGFPFSEINLDDSQAAYKVLYNVQASRFQMDDAYLYIAAKWAKPNENDRDVEFGSYTTVDIGRHSGPRKNPDETFVRNIVFGVSPYDMVGVSIMEWWFQDQERRPAMWAFVPSLRRVRRISPEANADQGFFGSTIPRDDSYSWGWRVRQMKWKLIGSRDMLVPIAPTGINKVMEIAEPSPKKLPSSDRLHSESEIRPGKVAQIKWGKEEQIREGYKASDFQGKSWWPTNIQFARRRCWVVEGTSLDPGYPYGRRILYIDEFAYWPYWTEIYSRSGEYVRTILWIEKLAHTPQNQLTTRHPFWGLGIDHTQNRASFFDLQSERHSSEYENGFSTESFNTTTLSGFSK